MIDIVTLTKKDCWGKCEERVEREGNELFRASFRTEIVRRALDTHPKDVKYVFSIPSVDYSGWERLTEKELLIKLKAICKKTGIVYKQILINEAIKLKISQNPAICRIFWLIVHFNKHYNSRLKRE